MPISSSVAELFPLVPRDRCTQCTTVCAGATFGQFLVQCREPVNATELCGCGHPYWQHYITRPAIQLAPNASSILGGDEGNGGEKRKTREGVKATTTRINNNNNGEDNNDDKKTNDDDDDEGDNNDHEGDNDNDEGDDEGNNEERNVNDDEGKDGWKGDEGNDGGGAFLYVLAWESDALMMGKLRTDGDRVGQSRARPQRFLLRVPAIPSYAS
ncbi:hypothetical protein F5887DRAFT_1080465 [Amanita rubescens]|nr:hypothetical protein F5887DRAFT_1080465 [Amanita rubescens]